MCLLYMLYDYNTEILEALSSSSLTTTSTTAQKSGTINTTVGEQATKVTSVYHTASVTPVSHQSTGSKTHRTSSFASVKPTTTRDISVPQLPQGVLCICDYLCKTFPCLCIYIASQKGM